MSWIDRLNLAGHVEGLGLPPDSPGYLSNSCKQKILDGLVEGDQPGMNPNIAAIASRRGRNLTEPDTVSLNSQWRSTRESVFSL